MDEMKCSGCHAEMTLDRADIGSDLGGNLVFKCPVCGSVLAEVQKVDG